MDPQLKYCVVMPLSLLWAMFSIHGARKDWKCLVDPPAWLTPVHSHSLLKTIFGPDVIKNLAVTTGWLSLGLAFYVMYCL